MEKDISLGLLPSKSDVRVQASLKEDPRFKSYAKAKSVYSAEVTSVCRSTIRMATLDKSFYR